jgi:hypothetical protein
MGRLLQAGLTQSLALLHPQVVAAGVQDLRLVQMVVLAAEVVVYLSNREVRVTLHPQAHLKVAMEVQAEMERPMGAGVVEALLLLELRQLQFQITEVMAAQELPLHSQDLL